MPNAEFEETKHTFYDFSKYFYYSNILYICILLLSVAIPDHLLILFIDPILFLV
jgi:hypothetical protein